MFPTGVVAVLMVSIVLTNGQKTGVGLGTCTYSFVVQSPYCGKDVGRDAEADIQRLQDSTDKLQTRDVELAADTTALKREIDTLKAAISLLQNRQAASLGETTQLRVTLIEEHKYIFLGCPNGTLKGTVYFMPMTMIPILTHAIFVNETGVISGLQMTMKVTTPPFLVYCSSDLFIVVQRRVAPFHLSFNRTWDEYKNGFGDMNGEFWLGLEKLYQITNQPYMNYLLRIEMLSQHGLEMTTVEWKNFYIGDESEQYMIKTKRDILDSYVGYRRNLNTKFITFDKDDIYKCGHYNNGFWYVHAYPHGPYKCDHYIVNGDMPKTSVHGPQISTEIKIRPMVD